MVTQVQQHDRQLGLQDIRLAELDLRFQILETASYNGILMWKIRDYSYLKYDELLYLDPRVTE
jgi:TNF receptor-associated factor 3